VHLLISIVFNSRDLALRSTSSKETQKTAGLAVWTLVDKSKIKLARLSVSWEVGNGIESKFAVKLSDKVPSFSDMWIKSSNNGLASTNQLDNTVYIGGIPKLRFVSVFNIRRRKN
jgi:hypothetical protein